METHSSRPTAGLILSSMVYRPAPRAKENFAHVSALMSWTMPKLMKYCTELVTVQDL